MHLLDFERCCFLQTLSAFNKQHAALQALYERQLMDNDGAHGPEVSAAHTNLLVSAIQMNGCYIFRMLTNEFSAHCRVES